MARLGTHTGTLVTAAALLGALGCTEDDSHLGGHDGDAGSSSAGGGQSAQGGSATGGKSGKGGSSARGGAETGGSNAQGGTATGGTGAEAGTEAGGVGAESGTGTGGRSGGASGGPQGGSSGAGTCTPFENPVCNSDDDCAADEYCASACAPSACGCSGGQLGCTADCRNLCKPLASECTPATSAFTEQLSDEHCTVMVRISNGGTRIAGYAVSCGAATTVTEEDALNVLLPMSSINWSGATPVGEATVTGVYGFKTIFSDFLYTGFISASTRQLLAITQVLSTGEEPGSVRIPTEWRDSDELGSSCAPGSAVRVAVFGIDGTDFRPAVPRETLLKTGVIDALRVKFGRAGKVAMTNVDPEQSELLAFVSAP